MTISFPRTIHNDQMIRIHGKVLGICWKDETCSSTFEHCHACDKLFNFDGRPIYIFVMNVIIQIEQVLGKCMIMKTGLYTGESG